MHIVISAPTTLERVIEESIRLRPRSRALYLASVRAFIAFAGCDPPQWTAERLAAWRDEQRQRGLAASTTNLRLRAVKFAARRLAELGLGVDFARAVELVPEDHPHRSALTLDEARRLVAACAGDDPRAQRDRALILLGLRTGLRREALRRARIEDLDGDRLAAERKGGGQHIVILDAEARSAVSAWLDWLAARSVETGPIFRPLVGPTIAGDYVIGDGLSASGVYAIVRTRARAAGLRAHPHLLRHTFVSLARAAGVPDWRIAAVTGHRRLPMLDVYTTDLLAAADPVGAHLPRLGGADR